ncbi:MAG: hypothetical protein JW741_12905 [Sedimentisphaerales bacterium]|nr:hypothetical protein [Sedimentisphaerales bacterium]
MKPVLRLSLATWLLCAAVPCMAQLEPAAEEELIGAIKEGSHTQAVHLIELYYEDFLGDKMQVQPDDDPAMPFSTRLTCGECHDYAAIASGWHFNSATGDAPAGRVGEPWVYVDRATRTQAPVSARGWKGAFRPEEVGLDAWGMIKQFGRHMPGGNFGHLYSDSDAGMDRFEVSGEWPVDCLTCHNVDFRQDASETALQVARENFRWAAAAGSGLAGVSGLAMTLPATYDIFMGGAGGNPPETRYDLSRFNADNKVYFDIAQKPDANRCYFCHSAHVQDGDEWTDEWKRDEDIHLAAGLVCADCHRNGQDHAIVRGYPGEADEPGKDPSVATLTCVGCHLGEGWPEEASHATVGRLGAPRPVHKGIPLVHFEKMTCTACHSGPRPQAQAPLVGTSRLHALGLHGRHRLEVDLPYVAGGVLAQHADGRLGPVRLIWPAYWGRLDGEQVAPIPPTDVQGAAADILAQADPQEETETQPQADEFLHDRFKPLSHEQIAQVLTQLQADGEGEPVYVAGGKLYQLSEPGKLETTEHPAAKPYSWPVGHNVRSASDSLGAKGCDECHTTDNPTFFGKVDIHTPVAADQGRTVTMHELEGLDGFYWWAFNFSFVFRPYLKITGIAACAFLLLILLAYTQAGLRRLAARFSGEK